MSLICNRNSTGPNIPPYGTPHVMGFCSERMLPIVTTCLSFPPSHSSSTDISSTRRE